MDYTLEKKEKGKFVAKIKVNKNEWEQFLNSAYEKNKGKYTLPGFRKGHAPRAVIEKAYGEGVFLNAALDEVYYKAYTQILREHEEVKPIDAPSLDIKKFDENGLEIELTIQCVEDFELAPYKGLTFKKQKVEVTEKDVNDAIDRELLRASRLVESKKPVKMDDYVNLDFDGYIDGKQFNGGKADNYQLKIGSHTFIDNFEEQLIGLKVGDKKDVQVTFPADYHEESLKNKPATFKVEIKNIREREMPKLDEDFVSNTTEFNTVEEYKNSIKERLVKEANERAETELSNDMLDKVIDDTNFTAPESMVDDEVKAQLDGMRNQMQYQGITLEDYVKYINKTMDEFEKEIRTNCARNVKARLVLGKLIKAENLDINQQDIDNKISEMAKNVGKSEEEFKKQVNNDMVNRIANDLLMAKIVEFLRKNNTVK